MIREIITYQNEKVELTWVEDVDFSKLKNVTQAYGVLFNDAGKIVIVSSSGGKKWVLPGGKPEKTDENYEKTLVREVNEEADVEIEGIIPLGYVNAVFVDKSDSDHQQLRYFARIKKVRDQTVDPAYRWILLRKFIEPKEFLKYCPWGNTGKATIEKAVKIWEKQLK